MKLVLTRVHQNTVAIDISLIVNWLVGLTAIVKGNWIDPNVLFSFTCFLSIVLPVHSMPIEVIINAMLKAGPDSCTRVGRRRIDNDRARSWSAAVIDPVLSSAGTFLFRPLDVVTKRTSIPDVDRTIEFLHVMFCDERRQCFARARVRVDVVAKLPDVVVLRTAGFIR